MSLSSTPSRIQIYNEFGSATNNLITDKSLSDMHGIAIGGSQHSRLDFANKAQPSITGYSGSFNSSTGVYTATFQGLDTGGLDTTLKLQIQDRFQGGSELVTPDATAWEDLASTTTTSGGNTDVSAVVESGDWFIRGVYFNPFIQLEDDWKEGGWESVDSTTSPPTWTTPSIISATFEGGRSIGATWNFGSSPSSFDAQLRVNSSSTQDWVIASLDFGGDTNWGTSSNPKEGIWVGDQFYDPGDSVDIRVRAAAEGGTSASNWSNHATVNI